MSYLFSGLGGRKQTPMGILFIQTASVTVANTTTETAITSTGQGSLVLPANFFVVGRSLRIQAYGFHSSAGNPTVTLRVKLGSTTIGTITGTGGNGTNDGFEMLGVLTCRTTGASGTVFAQGSYTEIHGSGLRAGADNTAAVTLDTTASQTLSVTMQWGTASASNTLTLTNLVLEALNP